MSEKLKTKYNKKRNTAFLYEVIVREITKAVLEKREQHKDDLVKVCKRFFSNGTVLKEELDIYNAILQVSPTVPAMAERILHEAKYQYQFLDKDAIFREQTKLIGNVNKLTGGNIFSTFVPDYKNLATVSQIFNNSVAIRDKVMLENTLIEKMSNEQEKNNSKMQTLDTLAYKLFVKKFNEQYGDSLLSEQKELITKYVMSFADNGLEFNLFLNEEISRLKDVINEQFKAKVLKEDETLSDKTKSILQRMDSYKTKAIDEGSLKEILKIQSLAAEFQNPEAQTNV